MSQQQVEDIWEKALTIIQTQLSRPSFETWIKSTKPLLLKGGVLIVETPSELAKDWLEQKYLTLLQKTVNSVLSEDITLKLVVPGTPLESEMPKTTGHGYIPKGQNNDEPPPAVLNPRYTFDTFVVGDSNRFAHAASLAVAEAPGKAYNPLFIYGGVGLGKTHLMKAIGNYALEQTNNKVRVVYVSSEEFTNEMINSIRDQKTEEFRDRYRGVDILLIDDIQFLAARERTQEEFFHTFNALHESNKQIVISSDRPPKEIPTLEDRLRSRFGWGLIVDIKLPDLETRVAILKKKANLESIPVSNDVLLYIATQVQSNIRELEGALIRVEAFSRITKRDVTVDLASEVLKDTLPGTKPKIITIELIQECVARHFNLKPEEMRAKKRTQAVAFPRQIAMYLCRKLTESSLPKIGEEFGGRDHTTVMHAYERVQKALADSPSLTETLEELTAKIKG